MRMARASVIGFVFALTGLSDGQMSAQDLRRPDLVQRADYQRVIDQWWPGFSILPRAGFEAQVQQGVQDGQRGSIIVGHFDFDQVVDFAALIVPPKTTRFKDVYNYYEGKVVVCLANPNGGRYKCESRAQHVAIPEEMILRVVPPGRYYCHNGEREVVTTIDSVGTASEKGGEFMVRTRNGRSQQCVDAD